MESVALVASSPLLIKLVAPISIILTIAIFWLRAGSLHSVLERIWRIVTGHVDVSTPELKAFANTTRDLERFRFVYGIQVTTLDELKRILEWLGNHSIGIEAVQEIRGWINIKSLEILNPPSKRYLLTMIALAMACGVVMVCASLANSYSSAVLQMNKSKTWFLADPQSVRAPMGGWELTISECRDAKPSVNKVIPLSKNEVEILCNAFQDGSFTEVVQKTLSEQRKIALVLGSLTLIGFLVSISRSKSAYVARELHEKINEKPPETLEIARKKSVRRKKPNTGPEDNKQS